MRDAKILLCDINIALEKHPPWYVDRSPRGKDHRLLYASADIIKRLLAKIDELEKEKASLLDDINNMVDELYHPEG